jgi:hypothetical protein
MSHELLWMNIVYVAGFLFLVFGLGLNSTSVMAGYCLGVFACIVWGAVR